MKKNYTGKNGISIKLIANAINKEIKETVQKRKKSKVRLKKTYTPGTLKSDDMGIISLGLSTIYDVINDGIKTHSDKLLLGNNDISKMHANIWNYRNVIDVCTRESSYIASKEYEYKMQMEVLENISDIAQAARDGVILQQEVRYEKVNGKEKKIIYDTSMTDSEIIRKFDDYEKIYEKNKTDKIRNYLELGLGFAGIIGSVIKSSSNTNKENKTKSKGALLGLGSVVASITPILLRYMGRKERDKEWELRRKTRNLRGNALFNEQISIDSRNDEIKLSNKACTEELEHLRTQSIKDIGIASSAYAIIAILTGMYLNSKVTLNKDGKIDGKSLSQALISLESAKGSVNSIIRACSQLYQIKKTNEEFDQICKELSDIITQMEEKVYPLNPAKQPFEKLEIKDFNGKFYPKKNYETGETIYSAELHVPEFSIKKGETVLLSGESGTGKSTFLRLLKRGDINNQNCIILDDSKKVDNLGNQYISFRPDARLGNDTNILFQITGKENISDLDKGEKERLAKIMKELELDSGVNEKQLLEKLASKKFMEFSTGQQKRLALSKLFYRITDGTSAIIVDEPVGNVEDRLIRQQFKMIKDYAKKQNVMLLLVTHRIDAIKDIVDKTYHIDKNGIMTQVPILKEVEER